MIGDRGRVANKVRFFIIMQAIEHCHTLNFIKQGIVKNAIKNKHYWLIKDMIKMKPKNEFNAELTNDEAHAAIYRFQVENEKADGDMEMKSFFEKVFGSLIKYKSIWITWIFSIGLVLINNYFLYKSSLNKNSLFFGYISLISILFWAIMPYVVCFLISGAISNRKFSKEIKAVEEEYALFIAEAKARAIKKSRKTRSPILGEFDGANKRTIH